MRTLLISWEILNISLNVVRIVGYNSVNILTKVINNSTLHKRIMNYEGLGKKNIEKAF